MRKIIVCLMVTIASGMAVAQTAVAPEQEESSAVAESLVPQRRLEWQGGADFRLRYELFDRIPQAGGGLSDHQSYWRMRPRVWGSVKNEDFMLYLRLTDEFRYYFAPHGSRNAQFPDEVIVDNLYLDLYDLGGFLDLRIGRQDFVGPQGPTYGAGRLIMDGNPSDGSRAVFMDAIKATLKFDEKNSLDLLAIYNQAETELSWGHPRNAAGKRLKERQLTYNVPGATGMDEYGGGLYFRTQSIPQMPLEVYYFYKRETKSRLAGKRLDGRVTHTWGTRWLPQITETLTAELEGAAQSGELDSGASTRGYLGYAGMTYRPVWEVCKPFTTLSLYYLSGDRQHGEGHNDTSWNPLWARWPQFSEMYPYHDKGVCYWSNIYYPSFSIGSGFGPGHRVSFNAGPAWAAVKDGGGGGDGNFYGWFGMIRYDFPLWRKIFGDRGDLTGHITGEVLDPGDYYNTSKAAYFLRWEIIARF